MRVCARLGKTTLQNLRHLSCTFTRHLEKLYFTHLSCVYVQDSEKLHYRIYGICHARLRDTWKSYTLHNCHACMCKTRKNYNIEFTEFVMHVYARRGKVTLWSYSPIITPIDFATLLTMSIKQTNTDTLQPTDNRQEPVYGFVMRTQSCIVLVSRIICSHCFMCNYL